MSNYRLRDKVTCGRGYDHREVFTVVGIREDELELEGDWSGGTHNVSQRDWVRIDDCKLHKREKIVGDLVWLDGYTSMAQQNARERRIEKIEHKFDKDTGVRFPIYFVADRWFDGRDGGAYDDNDCMYYIEIGYEK
jgi:hypothetical protein